MNFKKSVSVAVIAVGLMCGAGYAQAEESSQTAPGSPFSGAFGGVVDRTVPGGVRNMHNANAAKAEAAKAQPAAAKESAPAKAAAIVAPSAAVGAAK